MRPGKRADAWGNPLMGWVSSTDTTQALSMHMAFESAEEAIAYAERNGWRYELQRDYTRTPGRVDAAYAYNFVPIAVQVRSVVGAVVSGPERAHLPTASQYRRRGAPSPTSSGRPTTPAGQARQAGRAQGAASV